MIAYKLCKLKSNGDITSLFINKNEPLVFNEWLEAEEYPTKGFKLRPYWHCTGKPIAPHLSKKNRIWVVVEMEDYEEFDRPESQGGMWYLAKRIRLLEILKDKNNV
jgi:hypothetical protein